MIFEMVSWMYISLICLIWGNIILQLFFGIHEGAVVDFPIVCFIGMTLIGIISFYISLFVPLYFGIKLALQIPALMILIKSAKRKELISQIRKTFIDFSISDYIILSTIMLMILFLSTSEIIHPDSLNYHVFSTQIFDKYGTIPGLANLKPQFGFQSIWFSALAFFDFPVSQTGPLFILNGSVMIWISIFLISKAVGKMGIKSGPPLLNNGFWYLILILFFILSWTQIRLTASSLSPDFIAAVSILLAFYFFTNKEYLISQERSDLLSVFFSTIAITIKLSAAPVLLLPAFIIGDWIMRGKWLFAFRIAICLILLSAPVLIRNVISSGYPFYPSSLAAIYPFDWKIDSFRIIQLQHYITSYARFPIIMSNVVQEYNIPIRIWLPTWWRHLYLIDKTLILIIAFGIPTVMLFFRTWIRLFSLRTFAAFFVAITGVLFWFVEAPDPRFGTGFLLPLIYFQYAPFIRNIMEAGNGYVWKLTWLD